MSSSIFVVTLALPYLVPSSLQTSVGTLCMLTVSPESIACPFVCNLYHISFIIVPTNARLIPLADPVYHCEPASATSKWLDGMFADSSTASEQLCLALGLRHISQSWFLLDRRLNFHMVTFLL